MAVLRRAGEGLSSQAEGPESWAPIRKDQTPSHRHDAGGIGDDCP